MLLLLLLRSATRSRQKPVPAMRETAKVLLRDDGDQEGVQLGPEALMRLSCHWGCGAVCRAWWSSELRRQWLLSAGWHQLRVVATTAAPHEEDAFGCPRPILSLLAPAPAPATCAGCGAAHPLAALYRFGCLLDPSQGRLHLRMKLAVPVRLALSRTSFGRETVRFQRAGRRLCPEADCQGCHLQQGRLAWTWPGLPQSPARCWLHPGLPPRHSGLAVRSGSWHDGLAAREHAERGVIQAQRGAMLAAGGAALDGCGWNAAQTETLRHARFHHHQDHDDCCYFCCCCCCCCCFCFLLLLPLSLLFFFPLFLLLPLSLLRPVTTAPAFPGSVVRDGGRAMAKKMEAVALVAKKRWPQRRACVLWLTSC